MAITHKQAAAARVLLGLSPKDVMELADIGHTPYYTFEKNGTKVSKDKIENLERIFINRGIEFIDDRGVSLRTDGDRIYLGQDGFTTFMDDVYETIKREGGEICVSNVDERNWIKWMTQEGYDAHAARMKELGNYSFKIMVKEGDDFFIASEIGEYRHVPADKFNNQSCYAYGGKLANILFEENDVTVKVLSAPGSTDGFRFLFDLTWDTLKVARK